MDRILEALKTFMSRFGRFGRAPGESVLGIDVGSSSVKLVQLRRVKGKAVLETYGALALGPYDKRDVGQATSLPAETIAEALRDLMREANVTSKNSGFSIPLASSLAIVIEVPAVPEAKLAEMVPIEARKYIPVPISEVTLDWWVIPERERESLNIEESIEPEGADDEKEKKTLQVLLVAIHNDVIRMYQRIAEASGLSVSFLEVETFSAIRSLVRGGTATFLILDIGARTTKVSIVENGVVYRSHLISHGSQDITIALSKSFNVSFAKAEEMKREAWLLIQPGAENNGAPTAELIMDGIFTEVNRILLDYEKKYGRAVSQVILSGAGALLKGTVESAKKNLDTEVMYGEPFGKVEAPAFMEEVLKEVGPEFAVAVGIGLRKLQELE